jgi:hypothetical protein
MSAPVSSIRPSTQQGVGSHRAMSFCSRTWLQEPCCSIYLSECHFWLHLRITSVGGPYRKDNYRSTLKPEGSLLFAAFNQIIRPRRLWDEKPHKQCREKPSQSTRWNGPVIEKRSRMETGKISSFQLSRYSILFFDIESLFDVFLCSPIGAHKTPFSCTNMSSKYIK